MRFLGSGPREKFNWCPSDSPAVRVELRDIAPRTAITKEARLPSLASMLSQLKPPAPQPLTSGGRGRAVGLASRVLPKGVPERP